MRAVVALSLLIAVAGCSDPMAVPADASVQLDEAATALQQSPTTATVASLNDQGIITRLNDNGDGQLTGTMGVTSTDGRCVTITLTVPDEWLIDGTGTFDIGDPTIAEDQRC